MSGTNLTVIRRVDPIAHVEGTAALGIHRTLPLIWTPRCEDCGFSGGRENIWGKVARTNHAKYVTCHHLVVSHE